MDLVFLCGWMTCVAAVAALGRTVPQPWSMATIIINLIAIWHAVGVGDAWPALGGTIATLLVFPVTAISAYLAQHRGQTGWQLAHAYIGIALIIASGSAWMWSIPWSAGAIPCLAAAWGVGATWCAVAPDPEPER